MKTNLDKTTMINHVVKKRFFFLGALFMAVLFSACGPTEKEQLRSEVDSLRSELKISQKMAETLNEIGTMMDSIDVNRQALRVNVVEGLQHDDYVNRMEGLKNYIRDTQNKIAELEGTLKKSKSSNRAFLASIKKLKSEIESQSLQISELKATVEKYKTDTDNLVKITETQGLDILDKQKQIETKTQEVALLEQRVDDISAKAKSTEAAGYLAQAKAVEEIANRTKFAPKKKKASINESLELYRKALALGNTEAKPEIERLEEELQ